MSQSTHRVLLVDDDQEMVAVASSLLRQDGVTVTEARNASDAALKLAEATYDLVLLDLGLPDKDGFSVLAKIKETPATRMLPVLLLTAWTSAADKVRALDMGATDYLTKPFDGAEFRARVRCALRTQTLQEELAAANHQLEAAREAAVAEAKTKAELLAFKSHEIRSFMNGILPNAGFLLSTQLNDEQRDYVETIRHSSESILIIVNDILDFSRIESAKLELDSHPFDLRKCVEDALDTLAPKAGEKKLDLSYIMDESIAARVTGDVTRLRQILVNLIGNAVKFTSAGEVAVEIANHEEQGILHFKVRDTGIGIPKDQQGKLFGAFCQATASTSREYGGTGLGLSISRRLVEFMGGRMWLESERDCGSTFHFTLPLHAVAEEPETSVSKQPSPLADLRVLVVDDNPTIQKLLNTMILSWGSKPQTVASIEEAAALLNSDNSLDVVLLDSTLGDARPDALAAKLRASRNGTQPLLILLSLAGTRCASDHFSAHLTKPLKPALVRETVLRTVNGAKASPAKPAPKPVVSHLAETYPMKVLLCDDNAVNLKVAARMLSQLGYPADMARNGIEALTAFDNKQYDLVFMDVQMPEMDGLEATGKLRERQQSPEQHPNLQPPPIIVAMTASAMPGDRERCLKAGMDDYIAKPVRPDDLRQLVEKWGQTMVSRHTPEPTLAHTTTDTHSSGDTQNSEEDNIIDWERLMEMADNDRDMLRELVELYLSETQQQFDQLGQAVFSHSAIDVKRLAHKCAGGSATIGVIRLVPLLRELELRGEQDHLDGTVPIFEQARREFVTLRDLLELHPDGIVETHLR